jgi:hypothetical protein
VSSPEDERGHKHCGCEAAPLHASKQVITRFSTFCKISPGHVWLLTDYPVYGASVGCLTWHTCPGPCCAACTRSALNAALSFSQASPPKCHSCCHVRGQACTCALDSLLTYPKQQQGSHTRPEHKLLSHWCHHQVAPQPQVLISKGGGCSCDQALDLATYKG